MELQRERIEQLSQLNDEFERVVRQYTNLMLLMQIEKDEQLLARMRTLFASVRQDMNEVSQQQAEVIEQMKGRNKMNTGRRWMIQAVLVIGLLLGSVGVVAVAQDSAPTGDLLTNTPVVQDTAAPAPAATEILGEQPPVVIEPTIAPEPTLPPVVDPAPSDDGQLMRLIERIFPWAMAGFITLIVIAGVLGREAIVSLAKSSPVMVREAAISAGESVLGTLEHKALETSITLDDEAVAELRKLFASIVDDIRGSERKATMLKQMAVHDAEERSLDDVPVIPDNDPFKPQYPADGAPVG